MNVTYLLGAGASAMVKEQHPKVIQNGIEVETLGPGTILPLVKDLNRSMRYIAHIIENMRQPQHKDFIKMLKSIANIVEENHSSFDVYAKSLWYKESDLYYDVKRVFSIYFAIIQRLYPLDKRYDSFLSQILEKTPRGEPMKIRDGVKIISWNYDAQFELACRSYVHLDNKPFYVLQEAIDSYPRANYNGNLPRLVHLNGIAGLYSFNDKHNHQHELFKGGKANLQVILEEIDFVFSATGRNIHFNDLLSFSWEDEGYSAEAYTYAKEIARATNYLVVVGYSFPDANRRIDNNIWGDTFGGSYNLKTIILQSPTADPSAFKRDFNVANNIHIDIRDHSYFHIPSLTLIE